MNTIERRTTSREPRYLFNLGRIVVLPVVCALLFALMGCGSSNSGAGSFDFGSVALSTRVPRMVLTVSNTTKTDYTMSPALSGSGDFALDSNVSCGTTLVAGTKCSVVVTYTPTVAGEARTTLDLGMSSNNQRIALRGNGVQLAPGKSIISSTDNPLVALYTYAPQVSGDVSIEFGPDTNYGLETSAQTATAGTPVAILVAGMRANSTYHMRAMVAGTAETDSDQTFATTNFPADTLPTVTVTASGVPQPGIELMNPVVGKNGTYLQAFAIDLQGNLIWGYSYPDRPDNTIIQPFKLLPNGNLLAVISPNSEVSGPPAAGQLVVLREFNLAGVPVRQITLDQLNAALSTAGYTFTLLDVHHDIEVLPNGHWIVLANAIKSFNSLPGTTGSTNVLGDVIVDLDNNLTPVWAWNEFDYLDVNRAPVGYPDWTHSNAVLYSPGDGNLLVSSRHQSWIMKVDYRNGTGTGALLWRLGYQGDFTLVNGTEPQDWFYGQHQMAFVGPSTTGVFSLTMMDNGFTRLLSPGNQCSGTSCYTTVPIVSVDETARTATISWRDTLPNAKYSSFAGGTTSLANGNIEFDLCNEPNITSEVDEVTVATPATTVWSLEATGQHLYRANRVPSLYPGVQW